MQFIYVCPTVYNGLFTSYKNWECKLNIGADICFRNIQRAAYATFLHFDGLSTSTRHHTRSASSPFSKYLYTPS